ncbi:MotA-like activator of middle period transcription [Erwinia phage Cronus]|uniref:Transcription factor MotA, activation domain n=1 Tax=Erwinia phage Cronus TaxID=2163633 RepID=A0A2S1GM10_9CAUD|nr:MotA-like activator of middle period transcription [Erwinia phage Cronus]AWD90427.1 transcription factor MotA, activation domain [Erwinia phage Cronus]
MSKVTYIIKASKDSVSENAANVLIVIAKQNFISSAEVREKLEETLSASSVNSNIGVLIKKGLIEKSGEGLIITAEATDLLNEAARIYAEENKPELVKERKTRKPRGLTEDMKADMEFLKAMVKEKFEVKSVTEDRSNYLVNVNDKKNGIRRFEVLNRGIFRVGGYKVPQETLDMLEAAGMTYRIGGSNAYIDMPLTRDNMTKIVALF